MKINSLDPGLRRGDELVGDCLPADWDVSGCRHALTAVAPSGVHFPFVVAAKADTQSDRPLSRPMRSAHFATASHRMPNSS